MNNLSRTERIVYEYILCNIHRLSGISAKMIASQTFTTTTSVNRVCKKMGYSGYTELRYKCGLPLQTKPHVSDKMSNGQEKDIAELCQQLYQAQHIYLYARGGTLTSLSYLSRFLSIAGIPHLMLTDVHQLALINKGTLLLVSKSGETKAIVEMARNAKRKNIRVMAITRNNSSLSQVASRTWAVEDADEASSLYQRESQIKILDFIDSIGCKLLTTPDA
ncbi:MurR/RpiR family transcriptional regulator [Cronobacter sakazakii]|uniref:MurR/RpiR family transcriptional regulator n=1 Tax=Cronobacter sakazakii TaxID=28141 RepID=UPI000CFCBD2D|nr:MurR/RpiR family transcriptional regulator [Cronobacter sakazakii]ELY2471823.1 MurR/RpiR family transcriptional regulator [Cronobacter sakazakii]ELY3412775.1 MurR/RpiR family transcriptional regulator [Cronobacter sakazakii]ELY4417986.1 MurR/RpiR family transcriptional regulator [Cronobacter sakazakii]ELY4750874.1 MurR/RpiR family transcriptional regulator [Cronobacter sakazakii]ELY5777504.1 MurR/RpiR family transcriptional regulator [Cronobacter sakazakii]